MRLLRGACFFEVRGQHTFAPHEKAPSSLRRYLLVTPLCRVVHQLLKRALGMRERLCGAAELHALADVVAARGAELAGLAGLADLEGDMVADGEVRDVRGDGGDDAAGLVAEG